MTRFYLAVMEIKSKKEREKSGYFPNASPKYSRPPATI